MPAPLSRLGLRRSLAAVVALSIASGCGDDGQDATDERADQVRTAAADAGLPDDVADVLALAARGAGATFQISYPGPDGSGLVVSQDPPNRRLDALDAGLVVESQLLLDGVTYACTLPEEGRPGDELECRRTSAAVAGTGAFTPGALEAFAEDLAASADEVALQVEERTIAGVEATCLIATPAPAATTGDVEPDEICVGEDGEQLLVDVGGERLVADAHSSTVPAGTFDL